MKPPWLLLLALCGCAYLNSQTTRTYTLMLNGLPTPVVEKTAAICYTVWDSKSTLARFRNQSSPSNWGSNSFAPGTYMVSLDQSATSTNINDLIGTVVGAAVSAAIKGAK